MEKCAQCYQTWTSQDANSVKINLKQLPSKIDKVLCPTRPHEHNDLTVWFQGPIPYLYVVFWAPRCGRQEVLLYIAIVRVINSIDTIMTNHDGSSRYEGEWNSVVATILLNTFRSPTYRHPSLSHCIHYVYTSMYILTDDTDIQIYI